MNQNQCLLCDSQVNWSLIPNSLKNEIPCKICGHYIVTPQLLSGWNELNIQNIRHLLSAKTRELSDAGSPITLTTGNIQSVIESAPKPATPLENFNRVLLLISKKQQRADTGADINVVTDYPLVFAHDKSEFVYFLITLKKLGLIEVDITSSGFGPISLTPQGWERAIELQKLQIDSNKAFVAMWFDNSLNDAWENGFKPALESTGFYPYRVDREQFNNKIDDQIIAGIRQCGLMVADFTGHRGGVYFEAGFAMGLGTPVIYTCRQTDIEQAHFDTRQYNHITWVDTSDLKSKLSFRIAATLPAHPIKS